MSFALHKGNLLGVLLNPLAIGVTLGGQLLDLVAPRPKLRVGNAPESSLLSERLDTRTVLRSSLVDQYVGSPVASGSLRWQ